jgi:hypothetical protein
MSFDPDEYLAKDKILKEEWSKIEASLIGGKAEKEQIEYAKWFFCYGFLKGYNMAAKFVKYFLKNE